MPFLYIFFSKKNLKNCVLYIIAQSYGEPTLIKVKFDHISQQMCLFILNGLDFQKLGLTVDFHLCHSDIRWAQALGDPYSTTDSLQAFFSIEWWALEYVISIHPLRLTHH